LEVDRVPIGTEVVPERLQVAARYADRVISVERDGDVRGRKSAAVQPGKDGQANYAGRNADEEGMAVSPR
jgi:hypothetical protein